MRRRGVCGLVCAVNAVGRFAAFRATAGRRDQEMCVLCGLSLVGDAQHVGEGKGTSRGPVLCSSRFIVFIVYWPRRALNVAGRVAARRGVMA